MNLKERIKALCKKQGISMNKLEDELGFGKGYISKLGTSHPNARKLQQIADFFGVSLDYLLNGEESPTTQDINFTTHNEMNVVQLFSGINSILEDMLEEQKLNEFNQKLKETLPDQFGKPQITIAAHLEGDEFTEDEVNDILNYIEFVKSRKNKK